MSLSDMGGKSTSGSAYAPLRARRPSRAPIPLPVSPRIRRRPDWRERLRGALREAARNPKVVDGMYLGGVMSVVGLASYILAFG